MPTGYFPNTDEESGQEEPPQAPGRREKKGAWLQHIEQGRVAWGDESAKLRLRRTLVWHHAVAPIEVQQTYSTPYQLASIYQHRQNLNRVATYHLKHRYIQIFMVRDWGSASALPPTPRIKPACPAFNTGTCFDNSAHLSLLHMCRYCLRTIRRHCYRTEMYCRATAGYNLCLCHI